jgi:hypothetical protein
MGRTLPTIIQTIRAEEDGWRHFRRALRREDQEAFDVLWALARRHAAPASMASRPMPIEAVFMGMLVGLQRHVLDLEQRLVDLEKALKANGQANAGGMAL